MKLVCEIMKVIRLPFLKQSMLFLALTFTFHTVIAGGGWTQKKGDGYYKVSEWWMVADQHYTDAGKLDPNVTIGLFNTSLYAEYGFTDKFTGILYAPFFSRALVNNVVSGTTGEVITPGDAINGIGDTDIGFKYGLNKPGSKYAVASTLKLGLPIGESAGGSQGNLQLGDGEFNQTIQLDVGRSFGPGIFYSNAFVAFNNRTNNFSDEFRYSLEFGAGLNERKLWFITRFAGITSLQNGLTADQVTSTSIFANNSEVLTASLDAAYYLSPKLGVSAGFTFVLAGKVIAAAPSYNVGIFLDLKKE